MAISDRRLFARQFRQIDAAHAFRERPPTYTPSSRSISTHLDAPDFAKSFGKSTVFRFSVKAYSPPFHPPLAIRSLPAGVRGPLDAPP
jgi:hypothetical protein